MSGNAVFVLKQCTINIAALGNSSQTILSVSEPNTSVNIVSNNSTNTTSFNVNTLSSLITVPTMNTISVVQNSASNTYTYNLAAFINAPISLSLSIVSPIVNFTSGGGGGNSNSDFTWSATVTGSAKSTSNGFIAPVVFSNQGSNTVPANYQGGYIYPMTASGNVDVYFERILGETGSITLTLSTFDSTNALANTNYTPLSNSTLTWADGEIGWKKVTIPITSLPTGFGLIGINMTGSAAWRPTAWIWMQGTGHVPGAKYFQSSNGVNANGNTSGSGTSASPWLGLAHAISTIGNSGGVLYWQQNGTLGHQEWGAGSAGAPGSNPNSIGVNVNNVNCTRSSPLIIVPDPNNTNVALFDQGSTGANGSSVLYSNAYGINFQADSSNIWICGIHFHRCNINWNPGINIGAAGNGTNNVVWQCEVDNYAQDGSNAAGIKADQNVNLIVQDCYIHEIYSTESTGTHNPYTTILGAFEEAIQAFTSPSCSFAHLHTRLVEFGVMNKQAGSPSGPSPGTGYDIKHCFGDYYVKRDAQSGSFAHFPVQGSDWQNTVVRYCVCDATGANVQNSMFLGNESNLQVAQNFDIFNCVTIGNQGIAGGMYGIAGLRIFNTISQASWGNELLLSSNTTTTITTLTYANFNTYVKTTPTFVTHYNVGTVTYTGLAAWKAVTGDPYVPNPPDQNSTTTGTTPSYANTAIHDYRISGTSGRGGRPIGVGMEFVGIVNNFLNSGLPTF